VTAAAAPADALVGDPFTRAEIEAALRRVHADVEAAFGTVDAGRMGQRPVPDRWSPAEHLAHLVLAVTPVARALRLPKLLPRLLFGAGDGPSRRYAEVRDTYRGLLAAGAKSTRAYLPRVEDDGHAGALRDRLLASWRAAGERLLSALAGWDEASLDRIRLPHPILGKLTVREMLFFTLYHDLHHAAALRATE
jgi:hypothetical protein